MGIRNAAERLVPRRCMGIGVVRANASALSAYSIGLFLSSPDGTLEAVRGMHAPSHVHERRLRGGDAGHDKTVSAPPEPIRPTFRVVAPIRRQGLRASNLLTAGEGHAGVVGGKSWLGGVAHGGCALYWRP